MNDGSYLVHCIADEAFRRMDADNSGALDREELTDALAMVAAESEEVVTDRELISGLANQLLQLYDYNGDGVVDRQEYQMMVNDMAALRERDREQEMIQKQKDNNSNNNKNNNSRPGMFGFVKNIFGGNSTDDVTNNSTSSSMEEDIRSEDEVSRSGKLGSIKISGLKLDLRRLVFGFIPLVKRVTPGGPLVLEPFKVTITGSLSTEDIRKSALLDAALKTLVATVLRRRVRSFRDLVDGAVFYGRKWNMQSNQAPLVEVQELTSVEFDKRDKLILTGRAKVRAKIGAPIIENAFKLRTKLETRRNGHSIRLTEPELALVVECPNHIEQSIKLGYKLMGMSSSTPKRPDPLYSFFPIYSPFKVDDNEGFYMGDDNTISSIYIKDGALRFQLSSVLRPGRFLGNHYLAFTLPQRTFIITMEKVRNGFRAARQRKEELKKRKENMADQAQTVLETNLKGVQSKTKTAANGSPAADTTPKYYKPPRPQQKQEQQQQEQQSELEEEEEVRNWQSFFSRFVDGYLQANVENEAKTERLALAISEWFGKQKGTKRDDFDGDV